MSAKRSRTIDSDDDDDDDGLQVSTSQHQAKRIKVVKTGDFKQGFILKLHMTNFLTYDDAVIRPGPAINLIIGPNGTGKSAVVCAICLALAGDPKTIGRQDKLGQFVKYGRSEATVEIVVSGEDGGPVVIKRIFESKDSNTHRFFVNGKKTDIKDVRDLVNSLGIQVNNLCQFLPQDRVREFAAMKPHELLRECQRAVLGPDHVAMQDKLQNFMSSEDQEKQQLERLTTVRNDLEAEKIRHQEAVARLEKRRRVEHELTMLRKLSCLLEVQSAKTAKTEKTKIAKDVGNDLEAAKKALNVLEGPLEPLKRTIREHQNAIRSTAMNKQKIEKSISDCIERMQQLQSDWGMHGTRIKLGIEREKQRQENIKHCKEQVELARMNLATAHNVDHKAELEQIRIEATDMKGKKDQISYRRNEIIRQRQNRESQLDHKNHERERLSDPREQSFQGLLSKIRSKELRDSIIRVQKAVFTEMQKMDNGQPCIFEGRVFGPVACELTLNSEFHANILERMVNLSLLRSFVVEKVRDREVLMGIGEVDVVNADLTASFHHPHPIEDLQRYGADCYADKILTCPQTVSSVLCSWANLHRIVVGENIHYEQLFANTQIRTAFDKTNQYSCRVSAYTGNLSVMVTATKRAQILAVDKMTEQLREIEHQTSQLKREIEDLENQLRPLTQDEERLVDKLQKLSERKRILLVEERQTATAQAALKRELDKLAEFENQNPMEEISSHVTQAKKENFARLKKAKELKKHLLDLKNLLFDRDKNQIQVHVAQMECERRVGELKVLKSRVVQLESDFRKAEDAATQAKEAFRIAKDLAQQIFGGQPDQNAQAEVLDWAKKNNKQAAALDQLRSEIEAKKLEIEAIVIDPHAQHKLDATIAKLEECLEEISRLTHALKHRVEEMTKLRNKWVKPVIEMVDKINVAFGEIMHEMSYVGQVKFHDNASDVSKCEIQIFVKFHQDESIRRLVSSSQSGGEQSVSTAAFLLALQRLDRAPFRLVDEINQGMDATNERKVWNLLLAASKPTSEGGGAVLGQYFIVTPKLLSNLTFDSCTAVHVIFNGPRTPKSKEWRDVVEQRLSIT